MVIDTAELVIAGAVHRQVFSAKGWQTQEVDS